jgi:hypothetical protein
MVRAANSGHDPVDVDKKIMGLVEYVELPAKSHPANEDPLRAE